jgi:hypothetical protein
MMIVAVVLSLTILYAVAISRSAKQTSTFPDVWHGLSVIVIGLAIIVLGFSGGPHGLHHTESDLDNLVFWVLLGFGAIGLGLVLLVWTTLSAHYANRKRRKL